MQAISLMSLTAGQAATAPAQGGSQTAPTANAGLFQGMLLQALLGGQITPELAAQIQPAPQGGQAPPVLLSGPGAVQVAPVPQPDGQPTLPANGTAAEPAPTQATAPSPTPSTPLPAVSRTAASVEHPAQDQQVAPEAAVSPATTQAAPTVQVQPATPPEDSGKAADPKPAAPKAKAPDVDTSLAQAVLVQGQMMPAQATDPAPAAPAPQPAEQAVATMEAAVADPQLEAFVQQAVQLARGEKLEAPQAPAKTPAGPTFQDLVKLVTEADKAGGQQPANEAAEAKPAKLLTQTQPAAPEIKATTAQPEQAPTPAKAPKAAESPEKPADVNLALAPKLTAHDATAAAPDAPQAAPRQPVDPEQVIRQVSRFVKVMVDSKQSEVRLQLHPENLGSVGVRLVLGDGALKANLTAQDATVKAALEANLDQLKSRLTDQGFQVEQVHVTVGGGDGGGFSQPQHSRQGEQRQPQPQQPWRSQSFQSRKGEDDRSQQYQLRTSPVWLPKGAGARINSLA